jgi:hypothetical protein
VEGDGADEWITALKAASSITMVQGTLAHLESRLKVSMFPLIVSGNNVDRHGDGCRPIVSALSLQRGLKCAEPFEGLGCG